MEKLAGSEKPQKVSQVCFLEPKRSGSIKNLTRKCSLIRRPNLACDYVYILAITCTTYVMQTYI